MLGIDCVHDEATIKQNIDYRTMWHLDRNCDSARYAGHRKDPVGQLGQTLAAMWELSFPNDGALSTEQAGLMLR